MWVLPNFSVNLLLSKFPLLRSEEFPSGQLTSFYPINIANPDKVSESSFFPNTFIILIFSISFFQSVVLGSYFIMKCTFVKFTHSHEFIQGNRSYHLKHQRYIRLRKMSSFPSRRRRKVMPPRIPWMTSSPTRRKRTPAMAVSLPLELEGEVGAAAGEHRMLTVQEWVLCCLWRCARDQ